MPEIPEDLRRLIEQVAGSGPPEEIGPFADQPEDWLAHPPARPASDGDIEAKKKKAEQTHDLRGRFFGTVQWALLGTLGSATVLMGCYLFSQWGSVDAAVMISFNAAVVVNTIGLAYIVANYLFPKGGGD